MSPAGILFFCPIILASMMGERASPTLLALLTTGPFGLSAVFVWLNARHSRLTGVTLTPIQCCLQATCASCHAA